MGWQVCRPTIADHIREPATLTWSRQGKGRDAFFWYEISLRLTKNEKKKKRKEDVFFFSGTSPSPFHQDDVSNSYAD